MAHTRANTTLYLCGGIDTGNLDEWAQTAARVHRLEAGGAAPQGAASVASLWQALLRVPGVADIMRLRLQPPAKVLSTPQGFVMTSTFCDADVFVCLFTTTTT